MRERLAVVISPELELRRSVLACMLWENEFYEDGVAIAGRIRELVPKVEATKVAVLVLEARIAMKLRHEGARCCFSEIRRVCSGQVRPGRCSSPPRRAVFVPCQAA
jgi:hypothetical protein